MTRGIGFVVHGVPGPQGSKTHKGGGRMVESSAKVAPWRIDVMHAAIAATDLIDDWIPYDEPVILVVNFYLDRVVAAAKRVAPHTKPDLDKLLRSTCDALTISKVVRDDARIVEIRATKQFAEGRITQGADILVAPIATVGP